MRALLVEDFGPFETHGIKELPDPAPGPGEVIVEARAMGLNFPDLLMVEGKYQHQPARPFIPGFDAAGVVSAVGAGVNRTAVGDRVLVSLRHGAFATRVTAPEQGVWRMPEAMSFAEAATFPVAYGTSHLALRHRADLRPGETLLVHGASGGVGLTAVEIGKALEDLGVFHFEEPRPHYDLPGLATIADTLDIPIASGEMIYTHWQYRDLILQGHVDILQPDIVKVPGFTEFQKIAALASAFGKPITVHNTQPTISTVAHLHVCAAYANIPYAQEYNIEPISIRDEWPILKEPLQVIDGYLKVPDGPGLGAELDEAVVKRLAAA